MAVVLDEETAFIQDNLMAFARQEWALQDLKDEMADRTCRALPRELWASVFKGPHSVSEGEWSPLMTDGVMFKVVATGEVGGSFCTLEAGLWWSPPDQRPFGVTCAIYVGWARLPEPLTPVTFFMDHQLHGKIPKDWHPWIRPDSTFLHAPLDRSLELTDTFRQLFTIVAECTDSWLDRYEVDRD
jgi:hypothetical protein